MRVNPNKKNWMLISWIRLMLWYGTQRAREFFAIHTNPPRIIMAAERFCPDAVWGMKEDDGYCIAGEAGCIRIVLLRNCRN